MGNVCSSLVKETNLFNKYSISTWWKRWSAQTTVALNVFTRYKLSFLIYCRLFITPHFDGIFPDFTLTLRRRRNDKEIKLTGFDTFRYVGEDSFEDGNVHTSKPNIVPQIYACATMWHETRQEMTQLLKSMFRCDCMKLIFTILSVTILFLSVTLEIYQV